MEFCPKCGGMMLPTKVKEEVNEEIIDDNTIDDENFDGDGELEENEKKSIEKTIFKCMTCGEIKDPSDVDKSQYHVKANIESKDTVILRGDESDMRSTVKEKCPKCGHDRASYELIQTRSADEAPTRFFTCQKCHHKWRGYD